MSEQDDRARAMQASEDWRNTRLRELLEPDREGRFEALPGHAVPDIEGDADAWQPLLDRPRPMSDVRAMAEDDRIRREGEADRLEREAACRAAVRDAERGLDDAHLAELRRRLAAAPDPLTAADVDRIAGALWEERNR